MKRSGFSLKLLAIVPLALTFTAFADEPTWVSAHGDDDNQFCSRLAPCRTFKGALAHTQPRGVIRCLEPGDFEPVEIKRPVTIDCVPGGSIEVFGGAGITINIPAA